MQHNSTTPQGIPLSRRASAGLPTSVDVASRSFEIIITTNTPVRTYVPNPNITNPETEDISWIEVDEVLVVSGMDFSRVRGMPLLDNHDTWTGLRSQIGRVDNVRIEGNSVLGTAVLSNKDAHLITDIQEGFFGQVSAGYCHLEAELIERENDVPLLMVHRWQLHEASLVPVGADPNAYVRGQRTFPRPNVTVRALETKPEEKKSMELEELVIAAEDAIMAADAAIAAVADATDEGASEEVVERAKAIRKRAGQRADDESEKQEERARADEEATEEEKKETEEVRSLARSLGLTKVFDECVSLRAKPSSIRAKLRSVYFSKDALTTTPSTPVQPHRAEQSTQLQSARSLYENKFNKRA